jgi:quercetin dioxygenase-like cupin family protein
MRISSGRAAGTPSELRGETFTGRVWVDPVLGAEDEVSVNDVFFEPGARTHWHTHAIGQVLYVTHGAGFVRRRDGAGGPIKAGDVVHISPGEEHWHGAAPDSYLLHVAISLGEADWLDAVTDDEYAAAGEESPG